MAEITSEIKTYDEELNSYVEREIAAVELQSQIGRLLFDKGIELVLFRNHLADISITDILRLHQYAKKVVDQEVSVFDSSELATIIYKMDLCPAKIDIGKLAFEWSKNDGQFSTKEEFLNNKLSDFNKVEDNSIEPKDVVLFGFGRIGRLAARELIKQAGKGQQLRLRAIVLRSVDAASLKKRASLFENDSVHGRFAGTIDVDTENNCLIINGQKVQIIASKDPSSIDYTAYGIQNALLIDNTGVYTNREKLSIHLQSNGIDKVLLTAPGSEIPNIVYGINQKDLDIESEKIFSAASCTTNAISPILKVINDKYGVVKGHIETIHAYTNDQNLLDNMHKKPRRGRSAAINMVITSTGAGKAVTKVIPDLKDKLTANAVRVPTPNGSLAILHLNIDTETTVEDVQNTLKNSAFEGDLVNQIFFSNNDELVSNDIIGNECCAVFDSPATIISPDGKSITLYVWYDNEYGYTKQVIRLGKYIAKVRRRNYY